MAVRAAGQASFHEVSESEVNVVAAEEDVVTDGDAANVGGWVGGVQAKAEQAEVRGAAADIDHQHMSRAGVAGGEVLPKIAFVLLQPAVEGRLRFLEQPDCIGEAGVFGRGDGEALGRGVEGGGDGNGDLLVVELPASGGKATVPGAAQVVEYQCGSADRRDFLLAREFRGSPGQEGRQPVCGVVTQPGFRGMDDPFRGFAPLCPREAANDPVAGSLGSAAKLGGDGGFRQIEERGKRWGLGQGMRTFPLRNVQDFGLRFATQCDEGDGGVGSAEIDADGEAGLSHRLGGTSPVSVRDYSVRTWNSTFQRRSEFTCFIQSSSVPSSVTTALMRTGTTWPA